MKHLARKDKDVDVSLLDTPQRWGILPTRRFWMRRDVNTFSMAVSPLMVLVMLPIALVIPIVAALRWEVGVVEYLLVVFGYATLSTGLLERYIRRRLRQRRELLARELDALGEGEG